MKKLIQEWTLKTTALFCMVTLFSISGNTQEMHIESDQASGETILLGLIAGQSKRPRIQFSENTGVAGPTAGMAIEYNGTGQGDGNELFLTGTANNRLFTFRNSGFFSIGNSSPRGALDVTIPNADVYLTDDTNGTVDNNSGSLFLPGHIYLAPFNDNSNISYLQARREDNSGSTQLNIRTTNSGVITEAMQIKKDGDVDINGFVKLGSNAPAVKTVELTANTSVSAGGVVTLNFPTGITGDKVLSISAVLDDGGGNFIMPGLSTDPTVLYNVFWQASTIRIVTGGSSNIASRPVKLLVTYKE